LSIGEDQGEAAPGNAGTGDVAGDDLDYDGLPDGHGASDGFEGASFDSDREPPAAAKWGMAGLLVVYAGLGSYCVASVIGSMAGDMSGGAAKAPPHGVTRSVATALASPPSSGASSQSSGSVAGAAAPDTVTTVKAYAAQAAQRAQAAGLGGSADSQALAPMPVEALMAVSATAIGPDGAADGDHPQLAPYVIDPHSATAWITHWYASAHFGNLKDGTGLLLDMGKPVTIRQIELALGGSPGFWGADLEIRIGDTPSLAGTAPVATAVGVGGWLSADLHHEVTGRYVQIWFTKLPLDSWGTYQEHVYGVTVRGSKATPPAAGSGSTGSSSATTSTHTAGSTGRAGVGRGGNHGAVGHGRGGWGGGHGHNGHGRGGHGGGGPVGGGAGGDGDGGYPGH
jgi:hypothetical protein